MHNLKELKIWRKSIDLALNVYHATFNFPNEVKYALTSQIKRAAVSISSNIAEGAGRNSNKEFVYFLGIANGSAYELQTQLIIANRLNLVLDQTLAKLLQSIDEIQKMNHSFQKTLKGKKS